jgi:hypothetical protein
MNFKQKEVLDSIIAKFQEKFPEVQLVKVEELNPHEYWVLLIEPTDEERLFELERLQAELGTDALVDYGVNFHFMPASPEESMQKETTHPQTA